MKKLYGHLRKKLGEILRDLCRQKDADKRGSMFGRSFWAHGYNVSTVVRDEEDIRKYFQELEELQKPEGRLFE